MTAKPYIIKSVLLYGITHGIVDTVCAAVNFSSFRINHLDPGYFASIIILYNVLSFGLQPVLGVLIDRLKTPSFSAAAGCILAIASIFTINMPVLSICLSGAGNALFHVGGGIITLSLNPGKSSLPGLFVAPGAIGLLIGTLAGKSGSLNIWPYTSLLILSMIFILTLKAPQSNLSRASIKDNNKFETIIALLFFSIVLRSLIGMAIDFSWKSNIYLLISLTVSIALGKALGGILSDRYGWTKVTIVGLILSAPLIVLGFNYPIAALIGTFLFNMTMPVTLTAIANMLSQNPGFSFGLTTLALIIGAFPSFTSLKYILYNRYIIILLIFLMVCMLYKGLTMYSKIIKHNELKFKGVI